MNNGIENQVMLYAMQSILENMTDMVFVKNTDLIYLSASKSFANMVGLKDPIEVVGKTDEQLFGDLDLARRYTDDDRNLLASGNSLKAYIEPIWKEDGSRGYCRTSKFLLFDDMGNTIGLYGISRDVTWEYKAKLNYEQELKALFELPPEALGAVLFDVTNWRVIDSRIDNENTRRAISYITVEDFIKNSVESVVDDEGVREIYSSFSQETLVAKFESGKRRLNMEYQRTLVDGSICWVQNDLYFISDPANGSLCVMSILRDIDSQKQAEFALALAAERDALTGVYNRETTMAQIERFLEEEGADGTHFLFMIDVDNFKLINDTFGHQTGDETLIHIAGIIQMIFEAEDIVGRIGGDEFFALMKDARNFSEAQKRAMDLVEALQYDCSEGGVTVELSASVGISCCSGDEKTLNQLYTEADSALYKAKQMGKNQFVFDDVNGGDSRKQKESLITVNLRSLLENMDADMFQTELDDRGELRITYSSHSLFSDLSQNRRGSGVRGENIWDVVVPEDRGMLKSTIFEATLKKSSVDCICRVSNLAGQIEWRHVCGTQLPDQGDGINRMIHVATDITMQKQTEVELREKNSVIDFAMRNSDVNLWYFDYDTLDCQLTSSCQKAHEMPGVEELKHFPECLIEMGYVREDCIELFREKYEHLRKTGENAEFDVWFRKADKSGWWCERDVISPLVTIDGKVVRGIGIGKNVTAEKVLQEKYETFGAYRNLAEKNTRVSFRMNLTTGWFGDCITSTEAVRELYPVNTADDFLECLRSRIVTKEDVALFDSMLPRNRLLEAFAQGESLLSMECHYSIEDEHIIWLRITVEMMKNPVTGDVEALLYSFDVDHEKNMRFLVDKMLEDDYEFLGLIDVAAGRLMVFGDSARDHGMARNGELYEGEMKRVFRGLILDEYYEEGIRTMSRSHIMEELKTKKYYTCSFPARDFAHTQAGRKQWKFGYLDDSKSKILIARTDITSTYTAEYDSLTGLYNRETFYQRAKAVLEDNPGEKFLLLRFDIDRFKAYNDAYGTQAGDRLLAAAGRAARDKIRQEQSVYGRLEADHFVSIVPAATFDSESFEEEHVKWLESIVKGYRLTSSVGIYEITDPSLEISLMCDRAMLALRTVKDSYTKKIAWYDESLREKLIREQMLAEEMEQALMEEQFIIYFQPLMNYSTDTLIGAEALVRWSHPSRGLIPPNEFIPLFEKNGFILKLDAFVWEKSCKYLRQWIEEGRSLVPVSVNVSRCDLYDPLLCDKFVALLEKYNLPFSLLKLEITESAYMEDPGQLIGIVDQLRMAGFTVEMDDFGTGYSSLNMLKDVPVDILKLDTRLISESAGDERAATILSSIIRMAHRLGLSIIAEGVETKAQADNLKSLNCTDMQGYYFSRPIPVKEFEKLIEDNKQ